MPVALVVLPLAAAGCDEEAPVHGETGGTRGSGGSGQVGGGPIGCGQVGGSGGGGSGGESTLPIPEVILSMEEAPWTAISLNTLADVDPCPDRDCGYSAVEGQSAVLNDWTGGAFASEEGALGSLLVWGGGHNGYYGNEVYLFDLETLLWSRASEPTVGQVPGDPTSFDLDQDTCVFYDGQPIASHTYDSSLYIPTTRQYFLPINGDAPSAPPGSPTGCSSKYGGAFEFSTGTWSIGSEAAPIATRYVTGAYDAARDAAWILNNLSGFGGLAKYDVKTDHWSEFESSRSSTADAANGAIDPVRDLLVVADFAPGENLVFAKDLGDPDAPRIVLDTTGDIEIQQQTKVGFEWVPALGMFVAWSSGADLYYLLPPTGDWRTDPWVWTKVVLAGMSPMDPVNGPYSKFQVVPALDIALVVTERTDAVYAVRLTGP